MQKKMLLSVFNLSLAIGLAPLARAENNTFTYQGKLIDECCPANGFYEMRFKLCSSDVGAPVSGTPTIPQTVFVTNGLFTTSLSFGTGSQVFDGNARWLEIEVRTNHPLASFVMLLPRTELHRTPEAVFAQKAASVINGSITAPAIASGQVVKSLNGLKDNVTLSAGANITLTPSGNDIRISSGAGGPWTSSPSSTYYNGGNVGIGTSTPRTTLDVNGNIMVTPNDHGNPGNTVLTAASVDGTALYCHSYGLAFHAHNDFTGTDVVLAGGQAAGFTGDVSVSGTLSVTKGISGQVNGVAYGRGVFGQASGAPNSYGGLFQYGTDGNNAAYLGGDGVAADFYGPVYVNGVATVRVLTITGGADLAEPFQMSEDEIPEGSVVVIDEENPGHLKQAVRAYDTRVAGIVSGANGVKAGIALHQEGLLEGGQNVALTGRVYVKADASFGAIKPGDLLTTSHTPGHAMRVTDSSKAQGAILGKAMTALHEGTGMVLVLVSLQ